MSLLIFTFFSTLTFADQPVVGVIGIGYEEVENNPVKYDSEQIKGETLNSLENTSVYGLIQYNGAKYIRINNVADFIAIPPNTRVGFTYWFLNNSSENLKIFDVDLFLSRVDLEMGDITRLGAKGDYSEYARKSTTIELNRIYEPSSSPMGELLYTFKAIQPINIKSFTGRYEYKNGKPIIEYKLEIENVSQYTLCNISIIGQLPSGAKLEKEICVDSNKVNTLTFNDELNEIPKSDIISPSLIIKDKNQHIETLTSKLLDIDDENYEASAMFFKSNFIQTYSLGDVQQEITMVLLPYWIETSSIVIKIKKEQEGNTISNSKSSEISDPKYSFTIVNKIRKEVLETQQEKEPIQVLGVSDSNTKQDIKPNIILYVLLGLIVVMCIWILYRIW